MYFLTSFKSHINVKYVSVESMNQCSFLKVLNKNTLISPTGILILNKAYFIYYYFTLKNTQRHTENNTDRNMFYSTL